MLSSHITNSIVFPMDPKVLSALSKLKGQFPIETTSFDGRPFLIPSEYGFISKLTTLPIPPFPNANTHMPSTFPIESSIQMIQKKREKVREPEEKQIISLDDPEIEILGSIQKKVKTTKRNKVASNTINHFEHVSEVETRCSSSPITDNSGLTMKDSFAGFSNIQKIPPFPSKNKRRKERKVIEIIDEEEVIEVQKPEEVRNVPEKLRRVMNTWFDEKEGKLMFKVECENPGSKEEKFVNLGREELMERSPRLLLYFYENHLQFTQTKEFKPENLKRV